MHWFSLRSAGAHDSILRYCLVRRHSSPAQKKHGRPSSNREGVVGWIKVNQQTPKYALVCWLTVEGSTISSFRITDATDARFREATYDMTGLSIEFVTNGVQDLADKYSTTSVLIDSQVRLVGSSSRLLSLLSPLRRRKEAKATLDTLPIVPRRPAGGSRPIQTSVTPHRAVGFGRTEAKRVRTSQCHLRTRPRA